MNKVSGFISFGEGAFSVMVQGTPICNNKATLIEALRAADFMRVEVQKEAWNGERGEWVVLNTIEEWEGASHGQD